MKRISPLQKYAAQFRYDQRNKTGRMKKMEKQMEDLSKTLDKLFPGEKKEGKKSSE